MEEEKEATYTLSELISWLAHREVYLKNYYNHYKKDGIPLIDIADSLKEDHVYLMDREFKQYK